MWYKLNRVIMDPYVNRESVQLTEDRRMVYILMDKYHWQFYSVH